MKALETMWKGYRFRSRTEARWAVFFDRLGINFDYEPEGVLLPSGPYLPDFRLKSFPIASFPDGRAFEEPVWLEVKGGEPTDNERMRCAELAHVSDCPVLLVEGAPDFCPQVLLFDRGAGDPVVNTVISTMTGWLTFVDVDAGNGASAISVGRPQRPTGGEALGLADEHGQAVEQQFNEMWEVYSAPFARTLGVPGAKFFGDEIGFQLSDRIKSAYDAARSARFEFGQTDRRWPT